jgi:hypothetical protein
MILLALACAGDARAADVRSARGLWVWKTTQLFAQDPDGAALGAFCRAHGISEIYLAVARPVLVHASLPRVLRTLARAQVSVEALLGEASWYRPDQRHVLVERINDVLAYNVSHSDARFTGIHLDIEPQQLLENQGDDNLRFLPDFIATLGAGRDAAARGGLSLAADIPRKLLRAPIADGLALFAACPRLVLMLYELKPSLPGGSAVPSIVQHAREAIAWARSSGKGSITVGVRVADHAGRLEAVLAQIDGALRGNGEFHGVAVHDYADFRRSVASSRGEARRFAAGPAHE